jgi:hypothetical protein
VPSEADLLAVAAVDVVVKSALLAPKTPAGAVKRASAAIWT